jgi:predicted permease
MMGSAVTLTGRGRAERIEARRVTADWFRTIGVVPAEGRGFLRGEDRPGTERVVVLSHGFKERVFGPVANVLGVAITLDGQPHTIVGVLPPDRGTLAGYPAEVWPILQLETPTRRGPFFLRTVARLRPEASLDDARRDLAGISRRIFPIWADGFTDENAVLTPYSMREIIVGDVGSALFLLLGAVGGVLLIGIANVANLLLVRATAREREMALRTSLGASRGRLARQLLVESLLLAALGGTAGAVIALLGLEALISTNPGLPRLEEVGLDTGVLAFAAAVTLGAGLLFGLAPLLHAVSRDLAPSLRGGGRTSTGGAGWRRLRSTLVAGEFALAVPLLVGAVLLVSSVFRLQQVDPGYDPDNLISARVSLPPADYPSGAEVIQFWDEVLLRIEEIPGVVAAGVSTSLPPIGSGDTNNFDLMDRPVVSGASQPSVFWSWATPSFFAALQVPLLEGRLPNEEDGRSSPPVVVVSRSWADRYYPDEETLGKQLYAGGDTSTPITVVGVVGDVKFAGLDAMDDAAVYEPLVQAGFRSVNLLVRAEGDGTGLLERVSAEIEALDPGLPLAGVQTMSERLSTAVAEPRYWATLLGLFGGLGLLLAAVGIYGVLSYYVSRQSRDIGIRMALGADPAAVRRLVIRRGMVRAALGMGIGVGGALLLTRSLESLLFGISPSDPRTVVGVVLALGLVALVACYLPARRATRIDPMRTLVVE